MIVVIYILCTLNIICNIISPPNPSWVTHSRSRPGVRFDTSIVRKLVCIRCVHSILLVEYITRIELTMVFFSCTGGFGFNKCYTIGKKPNSGGGYERLRGVVTIPPPTVTRVTTRTYRGMIQYNIIIIILYRGERPAMGILLLHSAAAAANVYLYVYMARARATAFVYACACCAFTPEKRQRGNLSTRRC